MSSLSRLGVFLKGLIDQNPTFVLILGMCPTLAVTTSLENAFGIGLATLFVLIISNVLVSLIRNQMPDLVRMPMSIVIIAGAVTIASMFMKAYYPALNESLGIYIPLIVANCIVLGRTEAFASKNPVDKSLFDALGIGLGFTGALCLIGSIRELFGTSQIIFFGNSLINMHQEAVNIMILPTGAYLVMGLLLALFRIMGNKHDGV